MPDTASGLDQKSDQTVRTLPVTLPASEAKSPTKAPMRGIFGRLGGGIPEVHPLARVPDERRSIQAEVCEAQGIPGCIDPAVKRQLAPVKRNGCAVDGSVPGPWTRRTPNCCAQTCRNCPRSTMPQIFEGTNQIQRMVIARELRKV